MKTPFRTVLRFAMCLIGVSVSLAAAGCGDSNKQVAQDAPPKTAKSMSAPAGPGGAADPMLNSDTQRTLMLMEDNKPGPGPRRPAVPPYDRRGTGMVDQPRSGGGGARR